MFSRVLCFAMLMGSRLASDLLPAIQAALADRRFVSPTISLEENALLSLRRPILSLLHGGRVLQKARFV
jgi:hypothetical protein